MTTFDDSRVDYLEPSRRDVMKYGTAAAIAGAVGRSGSVLAAANADTVSGIVYESRLSAAPRQAGDLGIADILVSNGRDVVKTDASGRYVLPVDDESIIFVIKPSGYAVPVNEDMLPLF